MGVVSLAGLPKPAVQLSGEDGNAFMVLGLMTRALRKAGWTPEQVKAFAEEAKSGDYDHLLATCMKYAEVD
jgi:Tfp pilus assembly protein PilW